MRLLPVLLSLVLTQAADPQPPAKPPELNAVMMDSTVKVTGPSVSSPGETWVGTGFLVGRTNSADPDRQYYVLVTAAHVLSGILGERAALVLRVKTSTAAYQRAEFDVRIRQGVRPLWTQHATADVAVMYVAMPSNFANQLVPQEFLATDADFETYEFHPGDEVLTVGYPYGLESNSFGFPILRSGRIASYPLTPVSTMKTFMVDFSVFGGNSGGPIYINQLGRQYGGVIHMDATIFKILGLVSKQMTLTKTGERLNVAEVVHAAFIRETIALLPPDPAKVP